MTDQYQLVLFQFECCGVDSYKDWFKSPRWTGRDWVPDSCCDSDRFSDGVSENCGKIGNRSLWYQKVCSYYYSPGTLRSLQRNIHVWNYFHIWKHINQCITIYGTASIYGSTSIIYMEVLPYMEAHQTPCHMLPTIYGTASIYGSTSIYGNYLKTS